MTRVIFLTALLACSAKSVPPADSAGDTAPAGGGAGASDSGARENGDALAWLGRSDTSTFWETTDVVAVGSAVYTCTGVSSLDVHDASDPQAMSVVTELRFSGSSRSYPRCSHLDTDGQRLLVVSHKDEVQTTPWVALLDLSDPLDPQLLDEWSTDALLEEGALVGDRAYVAGVGAGVLVFEIGDGVLGEPVTLPVPGDVTRVAAAGEGIAVGTSDGWIYRLDSAGAVLASAQVGAPVQALLDLGDGRLAAALGSAGLALLELESLSPLASVDTRSTAVRLDRLDSGELLVANWQDIRVYDVSGLTPALIALDDVFEAQDQPRTLAAAASGDLVFAGEWTGLHAFRYDPSLTGPEFTPSSLVFAVEEDGQAHSVALGIANEGAQSLSITDFELPEGWSADPTRLELAPDAEGSVTLSYAGGTLVKRDAMVAHTNDPDEAEAQIELRVGSDRIFLGDEAPDFSYTGVNTGEVHTLSEQRGAIVFIDYFATF